MSKKKNQGEEVCLFCRREMPHMVGGAGIYICNECAGYVTQLFHENGVPTGYAPVSGAAEGSPSVSGAADVNKGESRGENAQSQTTSNNLKQLQTTNSPSILEGGRGSSIPKPNEIKAFLDDYVIGQEDAKRYLSVAVYNHYKRLEQPMSDDGVEIEKSNIIMVGSTGTGKTLLAKTIARMLKVPFTIVDATTLTEAGYVGDDVETIITRLLQECNYDVKQAERGIIFIDEIDKIARKSDNPSITRDVSGEGVQQGLLKLLEGTVAHVVPNGGRKHPEQPLVKVDTKDILFICGGAFDGIERKIAQRLNTQVVGFDAVQEAVKIDKNNLLQYIAPQDLKAFGLIPEIIGRLPILTYLEPLSKEALKRILLEPKNAIIKQYKKLLLMDGVTLNFEPAVIDYIVDKAVEYKVGARGLRSLTETIMMDIMYSVPSEQRTEYTVTLNYAKQQIEKANTTKLQNAV